MVLLRSAGCNLYRAVTKLVTARIGISSNGRLDLGISRLFVAAQVSFCTCVGYWLMHFALNSPNVVQEDVDNEVIIVHLVTGSYYSLSGSGSDIWSLILQGHDDSTVIERIAGAGGVERQQVAAQIERFLGELQSEGLIVPNSGNRPFTTLADNALSGPYVCPALQKYSDMQELLLVDPIHEVETTGWPMKSGAL